MKMVTDRSKHIAEEMAAVNDRIFKKWQSKRICKNCKFIEQDRNGEPIYICANDKFNEFCSDSFYPNEDFGCNQWEERKDNKGIAL